MDYDHYMVTKGQVLNEKGFPYVVLPKATVSFIALRKLVLKQVDRMQEMLQSDRKDLFRKWIQDDLWLRSVRVCSRNKSPLLPEEGTLLWSPDRKLQGAQILRLAFRRDEAPSRFLITDHFNQTIIGE